MAQSRRAPNTAIFPSQVQAFLFARSCAQVDGLTRIGMFARIIYEEKMCSCDIMVP